MRPRYGDATTPMGLFRDSWSVRVGSRRFDVELVPSFLDPPAREEAVQAARSLVIEAAAGHPEAWRALLEIHARLQGGSPEVGDLRRWLDVDSSRVRVLGDALLSAARSGVLVARCLETRSVIVRLEGASEPVLGPDPDGEAGTDTKSWIGLVLVDQDGAPVPARAYRVMKPDGTTQDGMLDSNGAAFIKGIDPGNCAIWCPYVEPHPETSYVAQPGDHVSGIAQSFGFDDYSLVWNDPGNADLASQRSDPHVLQPGDSLVIPEVKAQPAANKPTSAKHTFTIQRSPLKLRLKLLDLSAKAVSGAQVTVAGSELTTDGDGLVEATLDKTAKDAPLDTPSNPEVDLSVGGLNPSDDTSDAGYKARLYNLGFLWDSTVDDTDDEMLIALQDFQAQYSLTISGQLDDATKGQLLQVYGC
jgi:hypothetical protein